MLKYPIRMIFHSEFIRLLTIARLKFYLTDKSVTDACQQTCQQTFKILSYGINITFRWHLHCERIFHIHYWWQRVERNTLQKVNWSVLLNGRKQVWNSHRRISQISWIFPLRPFPRDRESARKNCHRSRKSSLWDDKVLRRSYPKNWYSSSAELAAEWNQSTGVSVDSSSIRKFVKMGLVSRRMMRRPLSSKRQRLAHVNWCKAHQSWTEEDWKDVFISDEAKGELNCRSGNLRRVRRG